MKRRTFLKDLCGVGLTAALPLTTIETFSSCNQKTEPDATNSFDFDEEVDRLGTYSMKMRKGEEMGNGRLGMGIADMDFRTDPAVSDALLGRVKRDVMGYTYTPDEFYDSIIKWNKKVHNWAIDREWICYVPGVITAINLAMEVFTKPGDKILVQPPVYDPFTSYIRRLGRVVVDNPLIYENGKFRMNLEHLETLMAEEPKAMILCNPHNPGGMCWTKDELQGVARICQAHGVLVLTDEIHSDLALGDKPAIPFCSVSPEAAEVGITFTGPTKTFNLAGLVGSAYTIIPNENVRKPYEEYLHSRKLSEAGIPTITATIAAYESETGWYEAVKAYLKENVTIVMDYFAKEIPAIKPVLPEASFLVFLDCRELNLSQDDLKALFDEKAGLVVNNGANYGVGGEGFIRMNIGCTHAKLRKALENLKKAIG